MVIKKKELRTLPLEIDLTGPDGNAWVLLGYARQLSKATGKDSEAICKEMMSGDYENLVQVLDREFGEYLVLYR
jgi:hypothetical protein